MTPSEEKQISDDLDAGLIPLEEPDAELLKMLAEAAANTFRKDQRINIRLTEQDLTGIQREAARQGLPYQTLISGVIHRYVQGDLIDRPR